MQFFKPVVYTRRPVPTIQDPSIPTIILTLINGMWKWFSVEFGRIQLTRPGVYTPPWSGDLSPRSASDKMSEHPSLYDWGSPIGDGSADDTTQFAKACEGAVADGIRAVYVNPRGPWGNGLYRLTETITLNSSLTLYSDPYPSGGTNLGVTGCATIMHDMIGPQFIYAGGNGTFESSGGGIRYIRAVQKYGTFADFPGGVGPFIKLIPIPNDSSTRIPWLMFDHVIIEEKTFVNGPWTNGVLMDGAGVAVGIADCTFNQCDMHIGSSGFGTGAYRMNDSAGIYIRNATHSINGDIWVGDSANCAEIHLTNVNCGTIAFDQATNVQVWGGVQTAITNTVNTTGCNIFMPGRMVLPFVDNSNGASFCAWYDPVRAVWNVSGPIALNGLSSVKSVVGVPTGGQSGDYAFRQDTPGSAGQRLYVNDSGAWGGIL